MSVAAAANKRQASAGRKRRLSNSGNANVNSPNGAEAASAEKAQGKKKKSKLMELQSSPDKQVKQGAGKAKQEAEKVKQRASKVKQGADKFKRGHQDGEKKQAWKQTEAQKTPLTKKQRRELKRQNKKDPDLVSKLLKIWEELRVDSTPADRVSQLCDSALTAGAGKLAELAISHDTVRVFEAVLKRGSEQHRWRIFEELRPHICALSKSKFGKHLVLKMLRYGTKQHKEQVFRGIEGRAAQLLKHKYASEIVEAAYNEYASAGQRASILQEFYGPELAIFKSSSVAKLSDALAMGAAKRASILDGLRQHLLQLSRKDLLRHSIVHHLLLEFLNQAPDDEQVLESVREQLIPMLHTREGVKAALIVLSNLAGQRLKSALKAMKTFLCTSATNEHGYLCIIGLLELVPSADVLHKFVLRELFDSLSDLVPNQHSRKVLLYLLNPRDPLHFPPKLLALLPLCADPQQLKRRLNDALQLHSHTLLSYVCNNMSVLCQDNSTLLFVEEVLKHCPGDKSNCYAELAKLIAQPFVSSNGSTQQQQQQQHIIERPAGHLMLKRLLQGNDQLVRAIDSGVTADNIESWLICNRGCFFLLQLYENCPADCAIAARIRQLTQPISNSQFKGAQLLAQRLAA